MGHPDFRQGGDLLKAGCLTCYLVALRAVLASIIVAAFFVSMNFCGGSMVSISGGGGSDRKICLVGSTKYIRILVGSRGPILRGGPDRSPTSHKGSDRTFFLSDLGSQCLGGDRTEMRFRGIHPFFSQG